MAPKISALYHVGDLATIARTSRFVIALMLLPGFPAVAFLCAAPEPVLSIFGPDFVAASAALRILALGQLVNLATGSVGTILIMTGHQRISLLNSVAGAVMVVILGLILIPRYGATGAAAAASITMAIRNISATYLVWRFVGVNVVTGQVRRQKTHLGPSSQ